MDEDDRLAEILDDWEERRERGEYVDPDEVVRRHPELADRLRARFTALAALDEVFADSALAAAVPERIGAYRVERELGAGGMGTVYLAETGGDAPGLAPGQRVALKVIHPHLLSRPGFFRRFLREAEVGRSVRHENVVRVFGADAAIEDGAQVNFIVMEYVEGRTLATLLADLGRVPDALLRETARQVAAGLTAIHDAGIVHRDLKPENVLITDDHRVRIMDLGVARALDASAAVTRDGEFAGTLLYAAPEQLGKGEAGPASDLYSLGVLLYELATGKNPFRRVHAAAVVHAHLEDVPARAHDVEPDVTPFLSELLAVLLAKEARERFASAAALREVLDAAERSPWWAARERVIRATSPAVPEVPVRRETALYGREADLALLQEAWSRARAGAGNTVLLEGEAGIGKTRLVDAFLRELGEDDVHVLYGSYPPSGGMGGLADAIGGHFGRADLAEAVAPYLSATPGLVQAFAALIRHEPAPEGAEPLRGDALHAVFCHLLRALAADKPLVWVVDDLHFASDGREVVLNLARAADGHRVLLLTTSRPGLPEEQLAHFSRLGNFRRATLGRLGAREVIELLRDAFRSEALADKLGARVAYKSDGVPFFVFEMIRGLREGQFITELPDGTWVETKVIERIEVPSAVRDLIDARLRGRTKPEREILDVAAVQGFEFGADLVAEVLDRRRIAVLQDLASIERGSGVVLSDRGGFRFDHHQIQEVLYEELPGELRAAYHALVGEALQRRHEAGRGGADGSDGDTVVSMCEHLLEGGRGKDALRHVGTALDHLEAGYRRERAVSIVDLALAVPGLLAGSVRVEYLRRQARLLETLGRPEDERAALEEALEIAESLPDPLAAAGVRRHLGWLLSRIGQNDDAMAALSQAAEEARRAGSKLMEAQATGNTGLVLATFGRYAEARTHHERHIELAGELGDRREQAVALGNLGLAFWREGRHAEAHEHFTSALEMAALTGDKGVEAGAIGNLGITLWAQGRFEEAERLFDRQLSIAKECGLRRSEAKATGALAAIASASGRFPSARKLVQRNLELARETGLRDDQAIALHNLAHTERSLGQFDAARAALEEADRIARDTGFLLVQGLAAFAFAKLAEKSGEAADAQRSYGEALRALRAAGSRANLAGVLVAQGVFQSSQGCSEEARASLEEALTIARELDVPGALVLAACELALRGWREPADALDTFATHVENLEHEERMEAHFLLWKVTDDREHLAQAHVLFAHWRDQAPEDCRDSMVENVPLHRDIMAAWREHGGSESETSVGR